MPLVLDTASPLIATCGWRQRKSMTEKSAMHRKHYKALSSFN